jgi:hypothetical protein
MNEVGNRLVTDDLNEKANAKIPENIVWPAIV